MVISSSREILNSPLDGTDEQVTARWRKHVSAETHAVARQSPALKCKALRPAKYVLCSPQGFVTERGALAANNGFPAGDTLPPAPRTTAARPADAPGSPRRRRCRPARFARAQALRLLGDADGAAGALAEAAGMLDGALAKQPDDAGREKFFAAYPHNALIRNAAEQDLWPEVPTIMAMT